MLDPDLPTYFEAWLFQTQIGKFFYIVAQPLLYAIRPLVRVPKPVTLLEVINLIIELIFDFIILYFLGWKSLIYLLCGTVLGLGLHPISGHFISGSKLNSFVFEKLRCSLFQNIIFSSKVTKLIRITVHWITLHSMLAITMNVCTANLLRLIVFSTFVFF